MVFRMAEMSKPQTLIYMTEIYRPKTGTVVRLSVLTGTLPEPFTPWELELYVQCEFPGFITLKEKK